MDESASSPSFGPSASDRPVPERAGESAADRRAVDARETDAGRYLQECAIGEGAMGVVYRMRDRETGERLAVKKLFRMDAKSVLRLKREFRSLENVSHPNLVKVYELGCNGDGWFLAMEYVEGTDLWTHLGLLQAQTQSYVDAPLAGAGPERDDLEERILPAFYQLAVGITALHGAGMLHRDLKPSNVRVGAGDRVVVLDFGLVRELDPQATPLTEDGGISGTPAYMAPEQATGVPLTPASDWYAFGAMFYEALTGLLPFEGPVFELIRQKLEHDPEPPCSLNPRLPRELSDLCMALLHRDPDRRPHGAEVLQTLAPFRPSDADTKDPPTSGETSLLTETHGAPRWTPLFGRRAETSALWTALRRVEEGQTTVVHVRGVSGAGKSALLEHFLNDVEEQRTPSGQLETLVLRARCYEREAMPFKALDGVMDALSHHLAHLDDYEVSHLLPTDVAILAQLFPVLKRRRAVQHLSSAHPAAGDAVQNRKRAEAALLELFCRLAAHKPVVIWIDDLQWGDLDSARILRGWLEREVDLPLLLLLSYRSDEVETSECLRLLLDASPERSSASTETLSLAEMAPTDIRALCSQTLGEAAGQHTSLIERIVGEAQGSPFLAKQLAALANAKLSQGDVDLGDISIGDLVQKSNAMLPREARHLLAILAVAGRPILPKLAMRAAAIRHGGRDLVHALRRLQLVRTRNAFGERLLEVYHDRVRASVLSAMDPEQARQVHARLLDALEYSGRADADWLHTVALSAGRHGAAFRYGLAAAERATATLAFERAAELYASCLSLKESAQRRGELLRKLATALGCCGRGAMAADAYLEAARLAQGDEAGALMRLGTSHLLRSGRFEEGEAMLQRVLDTMKLRIPKTMLGTVAMLVWERLRLGFRGLGYAPRAAEEIPFEQLSRIDAFNALRHETLLIDPLRATLLLVRQLRWALDAGERMRVLEALCGLCHLQACLGTERAERRTDALMAEIKELATEIGTPAANALVCATLAIASWMRGRAKVVLAPAYEAERLYRSPGASHLHGAYYLRLSAVSVRIGALYDLSEYRQFFAELRAALEEVRSTDNRAASLQLGLIETLYDQISGRGEEAVARLIEQRTHLPPNGFGVYHALHMIAICRAACATGKLDWGVARLEEDWALYARSPVRRTAMIEYLALKARAQLLVSHYLLSPAEVRAYPRRRRRVESAIEALSRARLRAPACHEAAVQRARLAYAEGAKQLAAELLEAVAQGVDSAGEAACARYALGVVLGDERGRTLCRESELFFEERGVPESRRYMRGLFPELEDGQP